MAKDPSGYLNARTGIDLMKIENDKINLLAGPNNRTQHIFGIVKTEGDGNCLFHALSFVDRLAGMTHIDIRKEIVRFATAGSNWDQFGPHMLQQHRDQIRAFRNDGLAPDKQQEAYKKYMSQPKVYGTAGELLIATVCWDFDCSILMSEDKGIFGFWKKTTSYDVTNCEIENNSQARPWYYFRFSGNPDYGHWEFLIRIHLPDEVRMLPVGKFTFRDYDQQYKMSIFEHKQDAVKDSGNTKLSMEIERIQSFPNMDRKGLTDYPSLLNIPNFNKASSDPDDVYGKGSKRTRSDDSSDSDACGCRKRHANGTSRSKKYTKSQSEPNLGTSKKCAKCQRTGKGSKRSRSCNDAKRSGSQNESNDSPFWNKRVLITGGGRCLGRCLVKKFYEEGATVFVLDRDKAELEKLEIDFPGVAAFHVSSYDWEESQCHVDRMAPLDHLVNNAGYLFPKQILDIEQADADNEFDINFTWLLGITKAFARGRKESKWSKGGTIVNISTVFDKRALPCAPLYCCSHAALSALTRSLAVELGIGQKIRVNTVKFYRLSRGMEDELSEHCTQGASRAVGRYLVEMDERAVLRDSPLNYHHISDAVLYLLGPKSRSITGQEISVDGGVHTY